MSEEAWICRDFLFEKFAFLLLCSCLRLPCVMSFPLVVLVTYGLGRT
jgi:hypothetical protein